MAQTRKNRAPKRSAKATTRRKARVPAKKATTALIRQVLNRTLATKYAAAQAAPRPMIGKIDPGVDYHFMLPAIPIQTTIASSNLREGDSIKPIRASVQGHIWYDNIDVSSSNVIFVKMFFLLPKALKNYNDFPATLPTGFLEAGTAEPAQWTSPGPGAGGNAALQAYYPLCKENYTLMKTKTFKFTKNGGLTLGGAPGQDTNIGMDRVPFSFSWKPPTLKYASQGDLYPTNYAPVMFAVAYSPGYDYDGDLNLAGQLSWNWQISMSYKDA